MTTTTRRELIGTAAAAAAGLAVPAPVAAAARRRSRAADVVVVGAGLAGLTAARRLEAAGRSVVVLEARDRVGGRTVNAPVGGGDVVEMGGQWVGPTQDRVLALAKAVGVGTFDTFVGGQGVLLYGGTRSTFELGGPLGPIPPVPGDGVAEAATAIAELDRLAATIPVDRPWTAPGAAALDARTFADFVADRRPSAPGRFLLDLAFRSVFAAEPEQVSLLFALAYIAGAGNARTAGTLERLVNITGGAQQSRFAGGSQRVSIEVARRLDRVVLRSPVRRIAREGRRLEVVSARGTWRARRVVVAVPPVLARRIRFEPGLPEAHARILARVPMGRVVKLQAVYDEPFWRSEGLAGYSNGDVAPVELTFDNSPPDGGPGVLLGFIEGAAAAAWGRRTAAARRAALLGVLGAAFGDRARSPSRVLEHVWTGEERWSRGAYAGHLAPGTLTRYRDALRRPSGGLHWAGTETATYWNGYMDGAVRSGERAAREVEEAL